MNTQIVLDFTKAGLIDAFKRIGGHALVVAALAALLDIYASLKGLHFSQNTQIATIAFTLIASVIQNGISWLQTQSNTQTATPSTIITSDTAALA